MSSTHFSIKICKNEMFRGADHRTLHKIINLGAPPQLECWNSGIVELWVLKVLHGRKIFNHEITKVIKHEKKIRQGFGFLLTRTYPACPV
jgi:hypothetical protein